MPADRGLAQVHEPGGPLGHRGLRDRARPADPVARGPGGGAAARRERGHSRGAAGGRPHARPVLGGAVRVVRDRGDGDGVARPRDERGRAQGGNHRRDGRAAAAAASPHAMGSRGEPPARAAGPARDDRAGRPEAGSRPDERRALRRADPGRLRGLDAPVVARPLRLLVLTPDFPPGRGGIQLLLDRVIRNAPGLASRVVTLMAPGASEFDAAQPFAVRRAGRVPGSRRASFLWLNEVALREARRFRPDAVLSGHIVTAPVAWAIRKTLGTRAVQYLYADEVRAAPRLCGFALRDAGAVIAISRHAEELARGFGADASRIHRIPPGVDLPREATSNARADRPTLLTVARLDDEYKGHDVVLRALPLIKRQVPDIRWVVLGDGSLRPGLKRQAAEAGLEESSCFLGGVSDAERDHWYRTAHVFVMPSRLPARGGGEGFGIVYLEAGARRVPVVAGNVGGAVDAVVDGETGVLVDPTDPAAGAGAAIDLLRSPRRAAAMGHNGAARARRFAWPLMAHQVE